MYRNFFYHRYKNTYYIWDDKDGLIESKYEPYAYVVDPKGQYKTLNGLSVTKVNSWNKEYEKKGMVFEHDVPVATRVLIDNYFESDEPSTGHRILFFDIEIEKGIKYSTPAEAYNTITSIAFAFEGKYTCLLLDKNGKMNDCVKDIENIGSVEVKVYRTEEQLLRSFISIWYAIEPTIVSAYNGDYFDVPYLVNRITNVLGQNAAKKLSPIGIIETREVGKDTFIKIAGVAQMDYLQLYKKFTYNQESSYTLDAIATKELQRGKIQYEGSLDNLFHTDIDKFIAYNITDVELMVALDKKMDLIEIARGICHKGHVPYDDFQFSSRYLDGAIATRCKRKGIITISNLSKSTIIEVDINDVYVKVKNDYVRVTKFGVSNIKNKAKIYECLDGEFELVGTFDIKTNSKHKNKKTILVSSGKAAGAFVKPPNVGKHNWVYSVDIQSLYPSLIITQNISLETQLGVIQNWAELDFSSKLNTVDNLKTLENFGYISDNAIIEVEPVIHDPLFSEIDPEIKKYTKQEFIEYISKYNATISAAGVIFDTTKQGIIPEILEEWFNERIRFKKKMKDFKEGSVDYVYYDRKQLITKILLNSLYGVLLLPSFRYYSKLSGESVTKSGQAVIKFSDYIINLYHKQKIGPTYKTNCVIYGDSDSVAASSLILHENGCKETIETVFNKHSEYSHFVDPRGKEFTFPTDCNFPYYDEDTKEIKFGKVQYIEKHNVRKKRFKIKTKSGKEIIVSEDHSIMISDDEGNVCKVLTKDVLVGNKVVVFES